MTAVRKRGQNPKRWYKHDVLGALGEGEQADVPGLPRVEELHCRLHEAVGDAVVPQSGCTVEGPKKPKLPQS